MSRDTANRPPFISVIVATYNRPDELAACLKSIAAQRYPRDCFEVIVVDDGGREPLDGSVAAVGETIRVTLVAHDHSGPGCARNRGAIEARGELLAFTDDDCRTDPMWLGNLAARFIASPEDLIGGRTVNALGDNAYASASQSIIDALYEHHGRNAGETRFFANNNMAVPARLFNAIGGFDPFFRLSASEDRDLCDRWLQSGRAMTYAPECVVHHAHRLDFGSLWRQHLHYGRGACRFSLARARRGLRPVRFEPGLHLGLLSYPFRHNGPLKAALVAGLVLVTQAAVVAGYLQERSRAGANRAKGRRLTAAGSSVR